MHSMPTALFVATESSAIAENGAIKLAKAEQDEETRRVKTQENQGHFSALRSSVFEQQIRCHSFKVIKKVF